MKKIIIYVDLIKYLPFANKAFKHPVHSKMFKPNESTTNTRGKRRRVIVPVGKSVRYNNSAVPSLARLLNT